MSSEIDWCIECSVKHSQGAKVFMREAVQRAEAKGSHSDGVKERVRGVIEELTGLEADTNTVKNETVRKLNKTARNLRKYIYSTKAEIGGADLETLREIKMMVDMLVDQVYKVREEVEECPTCVVPTVEEQPKTEPPIPLEKYGASVAEKRRKLIEKVRAEVPG